jgi:hypothetical protein
MMVTTGKFIAWICFTLLLVEVAAPPRCYAARRLKTETRLFTWFFITSLLVDDAMMYDFVVWACALFPMLRDVALAL